MTNNGDDTVCVNERFEEKTRKMDWSETEKSAKTRNNEWTKETNPPNQRVSERVNERTNEQAINEN